MKCSKKSNLNIKNFFKEWVIPIFCAILIALLIRKFLYFNAFVPTGSMIPTINLDDKVFVTRIHNLENIKRGDVIVFHSDELNKTLIKRLIGLPGDKIEIKNGTIFINGNKLDEDYVKNKDNYNGTFEVPNDKYFFLGDNRPTSYDARLWENPYIDSASLEGKAQFIYYPFKDFKSLN